MKWIDVTNRLPDDDAQVLVTVDYAYNAGRRLRMVQVQAFCDGEWETEDVTAWMSLPVPYAKDVSGCLSLASLCCSVDLEYGRSPVSTPVMVV